MMPVTSSIPSTPDLLLLAARLPYPPAGDSQLRAWNLLKFLSGRYRVHLGCYIDQRSDPAQLGKIKALCYETCFVERSPLAASLRALAAGQPLGQSGCADATLALWVARLLKRHPVRSALALSAPMAQYLLPWPSLRRVVDLAGLESEQWRSRARARPWPLAAVCRRQQRALLACEREAARRFDTATFSCIAEAALFERLAPESQGKLACFDNGVDADYFSPHIVHRNPFDPRHPTLLFAGSLARRDEFEALAWFVRHVFAPLRERHGTLRLHIPGAAPARLAPLRAVPGVTLAELAGDARAGLAHAALVVAPGPSQHGTRRQVLEAMAMQKVVVGTPQALDGIGAGGGREVLAAFNAVQFIGHIETVLGGATGRQIGLAARASVLADYSWNAKLARLADLLDTPRAECAR